MTISWIVFAVPLAIFTYRGYRQGILVAASRLISLALAYLVALIFAPRLAPLLENYSVIQGMAAYITAGLVLFLATSILLSLLFSLLGKFGRGHKPSQVSAVLGGIMGLGIGSVVGLVAVFALSYLGEVWPGSGQSLAQSQQPTVIEKLARHSANRLMSWIGNLSDMDPTVANLSAALVSEPRKVISHAQNLQQDPELRELFADPDAQATLRSGDSRAIQQLPAFQDLVNNQDVQALMAVSGYEAMGPEQEVLLAEQISHLYQRSDKIKNDKRVRAILDDPEFQQQLRSGNPAALLNNKDFMTLLELLAEDLPEAVSSSAVDNADNYNTGNNTDNNNAENNNAGETEVYRWVDDDGNVHYSDRAPGTEPNSRP